MRFSWAGIVKRVDQKTKRASEFLPTGTPGRIFHFCRNRLFLNKLRHPVIPGHHAAFGRTIGR
jgi:hypothetical protein